MNYIKEVEDSIFNLLNSKISANKISEETKIDLEEVEELKKDILNIDKTSFDKIIKLYYCSVNNKLDRKFKNEELKKGTYKSVELNIPVRKLYVSGHHYGLFSIGKLEEKKQNCKLGYCNNNLERLDLEQNIFINNDDCIEYKGYIFTCGYNGAGPRSLSDFICKHSKLKKEEIENIIFNNDIIEYDFYEDKIISYENNLLDGDKLNEFVELFRYNNKLIIKILEPKKILKNYVQKIYKVCEILENKYNKDLSIKRVKYINKYNTEETKIYKSDTYMLDRNRIDLVLEFEEFEIWLSSGIYGDDIFREKKMMEFIRELGIEIKIEAGLLDKFIRKIQRYNIDNSIEILEIINN
ncbi:MAG: hypothetical protein SPH93_14235 [Clostridium sp.]|uniref:hypothetical protein n=1 Tax=Clostridium sp. TaxID=1506 RepID=UPI002A91088A|nr:hypothetical protein [Clostridium sp.]MDY6228795.1 hypothetical protein [Clostridium sp.]